MTARSAKIELEIKIQEEDEPPTDPEMDAVAHWFEGEVDPALEEEFQFETCLGLELHPLKDEAKKLYQIAAQGDWNKVCKICEENWLLDVQITKLGGTVLHIAAYYKQENNFELLLLQLVPGSLLATYCLKKKDYKGNTPLHYAASVGSERMCYHIINMTAPITVLNVRNHEGETPLFLAALHGHKDAFLYLNRVCGPEKDYCIRRNGDTILHCAISEEHYELSLIILHRYKELVNLGNKKGLTPLHLLANKPSAFKSSSDLRWFENIIYHSFIITDGKELIWQADEQDSEGPQVTDGGRPSFDEAPIQHPLNYRTCFDLANLVYEAVSSICALKYPRSERDIEIQLPIRRPQIFRAPPNYGTYFSFVILVLKAVLFILEPSELARKVRKMKVRHAWSILIMKELLKNASIFQFSPGHERLKNTHEKDKKIKEEHIDPPPPEAILIAAKNGIIEMVEETLKSYPVAMNEVDEKQKNIVLLAVEHKQPRVYELLLSLKQDKKLEDNLFYEVDCDGNSALHLAARKANFNWPVPGDASQMQWEIRWYEYIKDTMQRRALLVNKDGQTPDEVFTENHKELVERGRNWLSHTSEACSVVAGLFVSSTFSTATSVLDGVVVDKFNKASKIFAGASFVSFYSSLIAVVMFLSILTSGCRERDFRHALPWKLLLGLTAFYLSIASTLISYTTGHFFIFRTELTFVSSTSYIVTLMLVTLFSMAVFPLFFHLMWATLKKVPQRKYRVNVPHWLLED
ncbi:uncharacterized protein LOC142614150 [Castanea sativa]|uniref:uncharacterized protein LOC142614150 n=1 Tax=Castanea sativa TaxID=21020 RepID=UPI003F65311C